MSALAFTVAPKLNGWQLSHNGVAMATFDTQAEAERAALAVAARHPASRAARVDLDNGADPARTMLVF